MTNRLKKDKKIKCYINQTDNLIFFEGLLQSLGALASDVCSHFSTSCLSDDEPGCHAVNMILTRSPLNTCENVKGSSPKFPLKGLSISKTQNRRSH